MGNAMSSSLAPECTEAKKEYDDCFNNWYSESKWSCLSLDATLGMNTNNVHRVSEGKVPP